MKAKLVALNARFTHSCLALFYIRHQLAKECPAIELELYQFTINDPYYELVLRIAEDQPDLVFFSTLIWNSDLVERLICDLRNILKETFFCSWGTTGGNCHEQCGAVTLLLGRGRN